MTSILLAAGVGKRMGNNAAPKCLLRVGGKSLLRRTLEYLRAAGVNELVLVTGYQGERVESEARASAGPMRVKVLENSRYKEGAILSLWTAREFLDRDVIVMDADVLCPQAAFERLTGSAHANCLLVDGSVDETGEEQMVFGKESRVFHIAKKAPEEIRQRWENYGESLGFLRLGAPAARLLRSLLERKVDAGQTGIEHEQVYPDLFAQAQVGCERVDGMAWTEIDTPEDLGRAEREVFSRWAGPRCVNRVISSWFHPLVLRLPLTPNHWTTLSLGTGLVSLYFLTIGTRAADLWAAFLFQAYYVADNWDGEVARTKGLSSKWGGWYDVIADGLIQIPLPLALAAGYARAFGAPGWLFPVAQVALAGLFLDFAVTLWAKARGFGPGIHGDAFRKKEESASWWKVNATNENFSWILVLALLAGAKLPLLVAMAIGCHVFWLNFFWKERLRLQPVLK